MRKLLTVLIISSLYGSLFAQQGLDIANIDKELSPELDKYTEIEMNLVGQFHYRYHSRIFALTFDGENIWYSASSGDSLIAVDKNTGGKIKGFTSPIDQTIYGLAYDGEDLWASAGHNVYKINDENGSLITSFTVPYEIASTALITGLTWHNNTLYCTYTAGVNSIIVGLDVENIVCVDTLNTGECSTPNGLTYMNGFFWIHDYDEIKIRKISSEFGQYEGWFPHYNFCYGVGITNDGEYMYCSDGFCNIYKYEIIDTITSINKNRNLSNTVSNFNIYPNPTGNMANLEFHLPVESNVTIEIFNMNGLLKELIVSGKQYKKGKHILQCNTKLLGAGEYIVKLTTIENVFSQKLIIIK